jgi:fibronectin-binding autotransporter adhesin
MKNKNRILLSSMIAVSFATLANIAGAANIIKADNSDALNLTSSYIGGALPTASDTLFYDSTLTAISNSRLGASLSISGINISSGLENTIALTSGSTLTIGAGGINHSGEGTFAFGSFVRLGGNLSHTSSGALSFSGGVGALVITASQTWTTSGRVNINTTIGGLTATRTLSAGGAGSYYLTRTTDYNSFVTFNNTGAVVIQNQTITISGTNNTNVGFGIQSGTARIASMGNLTFASSIGINRPSIDATGTLEFIGNTETSDKGVRRHVDGVSTLNVATAGQTLTMSGDLSPSSTLLTGGWSFGGAGNLTLSGPITDAASTTVAKIGAGTLTLSGALNTYSGATTVTGGNLTVASTGNINSTSDVSIGAARFNYNSSTPLSKAVTFSGTGGTLSGTGTITPAVVVTSGNTYSPGASGAVGTQTLTGGVTFNPGSIFDWDIATSGSIEIGHDTVTNTGGLAGNGAIFNVVLGAGSYADPFWDTARSWSDVFGTGTMANVFSSITGASVVWDPITSYGNVANQGAFTMSGNTLSWTVVPEPTSA